MPRRYEPKDLEIILQEIEAEGDRAAIAVAGSLVDHALEIAISCRLRAPSDNKEENVLFNDNGILGTFSEKIWAAYFLKIIGPEARRDIDIIRNIRNQAAHDMNAISFDGTPEIAARCRELHFPGEAVEDGKAPIDLRRRFLVTAAFFTSNLMLRSSDEGAEIPKMSATLAPSLDR
jgi:hypothetical protein